MRSPAAQFMATFRNLSFGALISCCVFGLLLQSSRVLCVGEDGHRQLEAAIRNCCAQPTKFPTSPSLESAQLASREEGGSHCGSCIDIPLVSNSFTCGQSVRVTPPNIASQPFLPILLPIATSTCETVCPPVLPAEVSPSRLTQRSLRTTVIRI